MVPAAQRRRRRRTALAAALLLILVPAAAIRIGDVPIPWGRAWGQIAAGSIEDGAVRVLLEIRLPRVLLGLLAGASLALAGLAAQTLFRNPLANPYVLGVSHGAAAGAAAAMLLAGPALAAVAVPVAGCLSGVLVTAAVVGIAHAAGGSRGQGLILAGIALSALASSVTSGMLYLADERLQSVVFWMLGGLGRARWMHVAVLAPATLAGLAAMAAAARAMNAALMGDRTAMDVGVDARRLRFRLLAVIGGLASLTVSLCGAIGFVGLVVPHVVRRLTGADHRWTVPLSAAGGAILLVAADALARALRPGVEMPVGIVTAVVGAPFFLWLLVRGGRAAEP